jgi:hypothetical protein
MFAHLYGSSRRQVQRKDMPGAVARERHLAGAARLRQQHWHASYLALEGAVDGVQANVELRRLPEHDVMLEEDGYRAL